MSGVFGVLALIVFKHTSWQKGIRSAKDRIKGRMIEIRLYQDDLRVVGSAVVRILGLNARYLALNFVPFVPLVIPFAVVAAQFVVRYAYDPLPVTAAEARLLPGQGTLIEIELARAHRSEVGGLTVELPAGVRSLSPLVRATTEGRAFLEVVATAPGAHELVFALPSGARATKQLVAGDSPPRTMQPRRVSARDWYRIDDPEHWPALWPAEPAFESDSPFRAIALSYPARDLGWLPGGEIGILATFVLASMVIAFLAVKPLRVQI